MAKMIFGGVEENVVTREEYPLAKALETLKDETIAIIGYGVQGPGQSLNLRDNGFNVIVGQRKGSKSWDKAVEDGWVPGENLFEIEEACEKATIIEYLLSDAGQIAVWPTVKKHLTAGKALYFSHGFGITYKERTGIVPPADVDVILVAPKGSGTSLRRKDTLYGTHQSTTLTGKVRVNLTLESSLEQIARTHTNAKRNHTVPRTARSILENSIARVQTTTLQEHAAQ